MSHLYWAGKGYYRTQGDLDGDRKIIDKDFFIAKVIPRIVRVLEDDLDKDQIKVQKLGSNYRMDYTDCMFMLREGRYLSVQYEGLDYNIGKPYLESLRDKIINTYKTQNGLADNRHSRPYYSTGWYRHSYEKKSIEVENIIEELLKPKDKPTVIRKEIKADTGSNENKLSSKSFEDLLNEPFRFKAEETTARKRPITYDPDFDRIKPQNTTDKHIEKQAAINNGAAPQRTVLRKDVNNHQPTPQGAQFKQIIKSVFHNYPEAFKENNAYNIIADLYPLAKYEKLKREYYMFRKFETEGFVSDLLRVEKSDIVERKITTARIVDRLVNGDICDEGQVRLMIRYISEVSGQ